MAFCLMVSTNAMQEKRRGEESRASQAAQAPRLGSSARTRLQSVLLLLASGGWNSDRKSFD